jgi:hypothetical protein
MFALARLEQLFRSEPMRPSPYENYANAMAAERAAWEAVRDRLPGSDHYSHELWSTWRAAMQIAEVARRRMIDVIPATGSSSRRAGEFT